MRAPENYDANYEDWLEATEVPAMTHSDVLDVLQSLGYVVEHSGKVREYRLVKVAGIGMWEGR